MTSTVDGTSMLDWLEQIRDQVQAAQQVSREEMMAAKAYSVMADRVAAEAERLTELGITKSALNTTLATLRSASEHLAPTATVTWTKEQVNDALRKIEAMRVLDLLSPDQVARADALAEALRSFAGKKTSAGPRGSRTPLESIPGRPVRVRVEKIDDGTKICEQRGDTKMSTASIRTAIHKFLERNGVTPTVELQAEIKDAVAAVIVDGKAEATIAGAFRVFPVA